MSAILCIPYDFTVDSGSFQATAPITNTNFDPPGLVWRSNGLTGVYAILTGFGGRLVDTIALIGTNLRSTDTVRFRGAATAAMTSPLFDITIPAWSGVAPADGAITVQAFDTTYSPTFIRIDITSTGNPAGFVETQRIVIGDRVQCDGVDIGCSAGFDDGSTKSDELGFTIIDRFRVRDTWKFTVSNIKESDWWSSWYPLLRTAGEQQSMLFIPDNDPSFLQNQAILAYCMAAADGSYKAGELLVATLALKQV